MALIVLNLRDMRSDRQMQAEFETLDALRTELERLWLAEAERALAENLSTFAVLDIVELLRENGLLAQLRARGYEVREPR